MTDAVSVPLMRLAVEGKTDLLETAWLEQLEQPGPAPMYLGVIAALPAGPNSRSLSSSLLSLLLTAYQERAAHADVLTVARELLPMRPRGVELPEVIERALTGVHGQETWFEPFMNLSGLRRERSALEVATGASVGFEAALERFEKLRRLMPGAAVYHRSGWGEGLILSADYPAGSFNVRFRRDGVVRPMLFSSALDVLVVLDPSDLRARLLTDLDGLRREAEESPAQLVRAVARLHKGRATVKELKEWLMPAVLDEKAWAGWWRKAKSAAMQDPFLAVDNAARPVFVLRGSALTAEEELSAAMDRCASLTALLDVTRAPLALDLPPALKTAVLDRLAKGADAEKEDAAARVEAALLLVRAGAREQAWCRQLVDQLSGDGQGFLSLAGRLSSVGLRREALDAFIGARPRLWWDGLIGELNNLPAGLLDAVCDRLMSEGRGAALANRFHIILLSPSRQPAVTLRLARRFVTGMFDGVAEAPGASEVFQGLMHLAETQAPKAARGDKAAKETMKSLEEALLAGPAPCFVARIAQHGTRSDLEAAYGVLARCRSIPESISGALHREVEKRFPDLVPRDEVPFWERNAIFSTSAGIARRREEHRVLIEEKIPANSRDIGRAASYGDLSENFEWTAAIEQQRQLTEKAAAMEAELRLAQAIEDQPFEEGVVAPGSRVKYIQDGETHTILILGPWDNGPGVVSYRAPLAAGMLGARAGGSVVAELPSGPVTVKILQVDRAP